MLAVNYKECRTIHLNACSMSEPKTLPESSVTHLEKEGVEKGSAWMKTGVAYQAIHATRSSTIDLVLSTNSVALLAWIGEKYLSWSDELLPIDTILEAVSLYWFSPNNFSNTIYTYRSLLIPRPQRLS